MTSAAAAAAAVEEIDPLAAALEEAESLMESLGTSADNDDDDDDAAAASSGDFAIDSDDEDLGLNLPADDDPVDNSNNWHPLHDDFLKGTTPAATTAPASTASNATTTAATTPTASTITANGSPFSFQQQPQQPPFVPQPQQPQQSSFPPGNTTSMGSLMMMNGGGGSSSGAAAASAAAAPSVDAFKASTSRFASNLATLAQRAASQVQTAVNTTVAAAPQSQQQQQQQHRMMVVGGTGAMQPQQPQQYPTPSQQQSSPQQPLMVTTATSEQQESSDSSIPELDADAKQALLQTHVGDLIPGERVIMFLTNLRHVSDSTGFQSNNDGTSGTNGSGGGGGAVCWCCAMTYYRLLLFATHPSQAAPKPSAWNSAAWPTKPPPTVLQLPLASLASVERTVVAVQSFPSSSGNSHSNSNSMMMMNTMMMNSNGIGNNNSLSQMPAMMPMPMQQQHTGVMVRSKLPHGYRICFATAHPSDAARAHEALTNYAFPGRRNLGYLFAFESKRDDVLRSVVTDSATGTKTVTLPPFRRRFDAVAEFERQFGTNTTTTATAQQQPQPPRPWSLWTATNAAYQVCLSYPSVLVGPASLDESAHPDAARVVRQCAAFRSERRLPALTWGARQGGGGGSIWRCAQPKIGLQGNRSSADELFLRHIAEAAASANALTSAAAVPPVSVLVQLTGAASASEVYSNWMPNGIQLKILDLRPRSAAMANRTGGYGYENTSNYAGCSLQFGNIANIHAVRDAYQKLAALCGSAGASDLAFRTAVEDTKWLSHLRLIWSAAWEAAYWVHVHRLPVLVHCSHGWDRTSQVAALAQLLLDPHYRTRGGFACLCEKEFMSFGHPFHTRCGHGEGTSSSGSGGNNGGGGGVGSTGAASSAIDEGQISPIFLQFLDCVYQVVRQYPECFEFNTKYILCLSEHIYSCRFGNFLCDTERERELVAGIRQRTHSVWDYLEERPDLVNGGAPFDPNDAGSAGGGGVLLMPLPTLLRNITLWTDRHCAQGPKPTLRWLGSAGEPTAESNSSNNKFRMDQPGGDILTEQEVQKLLFRQLTTSNGENNKKETPSSSSSSSSVPTADGTDVKADAAASTERPLMESQSSRVSSNDDGTSSNKNAPASEASDLL